MIAMPAYIKFMIYLSIMTIMVIWFGLEVQKQKFDYDASLPLFIDETSSKYDVLLLYVYADTHPYALENLKFFVRTAVRENDRVHYYFIIQQNGRYAMNLARLPSLPSNARYVPHENKCFDLGTIGWFLRTRLIKNDTNNIKSYKYFILMNSSVRGPFFPPYFINLWKTYKNRCDESFYWYSIFTRRLNHRVKLVGVTISCQVTPHVQSYFLATDLAGLLLLLRPENGSDIFHCYQSQNEVIKYGELAASSRILRQGFWIDSLQSKYQGWDFSKRENQACSDRNNPYTDRSVDGLTLDPYETVFVKFNYKGYNQAADRAAVYQKWLSGVKIKYL